MPQASKPQKALRRWLGIPGQIEKSIARLPARGLELRGGPDGWSIRETVHHVVEANLVASNILLAALASSGCRYDWSWVQPFGPWLRRVGYHKAPVRPALDALRALSRHIGVLIEGNSDGLRRKVRLLDAPGAKLYTRTVEQILEQELAHARGHLRGLASIRKAHRA